MPRMVLFYRRPDARRWAMANLPPSFTTRAAAERELVHDGTVTIEDKDGATVTMRDYMIGAAPAHAKQDPVAAEIVRRLYRGDLVPSVFRAGTIPSPLAAASVVLVAAGPLQNYVMDRLRTAKTQHERAILEQQLALAVPPDDAKPWGVCRFCGRVYLLAAPTALRNLCQRPKCRRKADAERKKEEYRSSVTVREKKIAAVTARRQRARAVAAKGRPA